MPPAYTPVPMTIGSTCPERIGDCLYLFNNNQRLQDNPSLQYAYLNFWKVVPVLVIPDHAYNEDYHGIQEMGLFRRQFLLESALALKAALAKKKVELILLRGNAETSTRLKEICEAHDLHNVVTSFPRGVYARECLRDLCTHARVYTCEDETLLLSEDLPFVQVPELFTHFRKQVERHLQVRDLCQTPLFNAYYNEYNFGDDFEPIEAERHPNSALPFRGGEAAAHQRLEHYLGETEQLAMYKETRNGMIGTDFSSKFSAFLALGNLSPVQIYYAVEDFERTIKKNKSTYWLVFELLWREFFIWVAQQHQHKIFQIGGILERDDLQYRQHERAFLQWCEGRTDHPYINANMNELVATGYMSNRGRQNVASYLWHDLNIDWRWGAAFFEQHLIDYDVSSNWCNWMYIAGVGNRNRVNKFNPTTQRKRYDPDNKYVALWT